LIEPILLCNNNFPLKQLTFLVRTIFAHWFSVRPCLGAINIEPVTTKWLAFFVSGRWGSNQAW